MIELCFFSLDQWEIRIHLLWENCFKIPHNCDPHLNQTKSNDLLPLTIAGVLVCKTNHYNISFHVKYFIYNLQPSSLFTEKEEPWGLWVVTQYPAHTLSYPDSLPDRLPRESSKQEYLRRRNSFATWFQSFPTLIFWVAGVRENVWEYFLSWNGG